MKNIYTAFVQKAILSISMTFLFVPIYFGNYELTTLKPPYYSIDIVSIEELKNNKQYKNCETRYRVFNNIGVTFSNNTDLTAAIRNYNKSLELFPNNIYVLFNRANAYLRQGKNELAIEDYLKMMGDQRIDQQVVKLHLARAYEQLGRIETAINLYRNVQLFEGAFNASVLLRDQNRIEAAISEAKRALELNKNNVDAQFHYASLLYTINDINNAIVYLKRSMKNKDQLKLKQHELANYYLMNGDLNNARKTFEKVIDQKARNSFYSNGLIGLSRVDLMEEKYYECISRLKKILKRDANNPLANKIIADAYLNMDEFQKASMHYHVAREHGLYNEGTIGLVVVNYLQGFYVQASNFYNGLENIASLELSYDTYLTMALNEYQLKRLSGMESYLKQAIKKDPGRHEAYGYLAKIQYDQFQLYKALENYKKAISLADDKKVYRVNLANCYAQMDKYKKALKVFKQAVSADPNYSKAHSGMAMCLLMLERHEEALASIEKALETDPEEPFNYMNKAYVLSSYALEMEDDSLKNIVLNEAMENINTANTLDTSWISVYYDNNLALVYMELGEYDRAEELFSNQVDRVSLNNLGVLFKRKGDNGEASAKFEESLIQAPGYNAPQNNLNRLNDKTTWNSFFNRKNPIDEWTTYWVFLTNDLLEMEKHEFSVIKYEPTLSQELPIELKYYAFKEKKKKVDNVEEHDLEGEGLYEGNGSDHTCPKFSDL